MSDIKNTNKFRAAGLFQAVRIDRLLGSERLSVSNQQVAGMSASRNEDLNRLQTSYVGRRVTVDATRPELSRWASQVGRVVAVNCNGRALVQFDGPDLAWHDIALEFLKLQADQSAAATAGGEKQPQELLSKPE